MASGQESRPGRNRRAKQREIRVCLLSGDEGLRGELEQSLRKAEGIVLTGSFPGGTSLSSALGQTNPSVVILDHSVLDLGSQPALVQARKKFGQCRVVVIAPLDDGVVRRCMEMDPDGFLVRGRFGPEELARVVREAAEGIPLCCWARLLLMEMLRVSQPDPRLWDDLTEREREIAVLLKERLSDMEISERLQLSVNTIRTHIGHIFGKVGGGNRVDVIARLWRTLRIRRTK